MHILNQYIDIDIFEFGNIRQLDKLNTYSFFNLWVMSFSISWHCTVYCMYLSGETQTMCTAQFYRDMYKICKIWQYNYKTLDGSLKLYVKT